MTTRILAAPVVSETPLAGAAGRFDRVWTAVLRRLASHWRDGCLTVETPGGLHHRFEGRAAGPEGAPVAELKLHRMRAVRRLLTGGALGFAEAYIAGDWDTPELVDLMRLALRNEAGLGAALRGRRLLGLGARLWHLMRANTRRGSARNIAYHYDLGNAFYAAWLDAGMNYSSALFSSANEALEAAQQAKIARVCALADARPGQRVLEIGCGWGALAEALARRHGCRVTGITLSHEQLAYARRRLAREVSDGTADLQWLDYRDTQGTFDRIVSVEMLEAVGQENWPTYFDIVHRRLAPGGRAVIQAITIADERFAAYARGVDFIQRYIFPGGFLPSPQQIRAQAEAAGLVLTSSERFGDSYARTLAEWRRRFHAAWPEIEAMGFDTRFCRLWDYYLAYCEAGFRERTIDVGLYILTRPA